MNLPSLIILLAVAAAVAAIVFRQFFAHRRRHRSCCDCDATGCALRLLLSGQKDRKARHKAQ